MAAVIKHTVSAAQYRKPRLAEKLTDHFRIVDGLPDVLLKLQLVVFVYPNLQIDLLFPGAGHLEPYPYRFREVHFKGFSGGYLLLVEDIKDEIATTAGIRIHIPEDLLHILQTSNMVYRISRTGNQIILLGRAIGDHVRHIIRNLRTGLPCNLNHTLRKIHARSLNSALLQNPTEYTGSAGKIHGSFRLNSSLDQPLKQLLTENLRIIVPAKFIIYLTKHITIHPNSPLLYHSTTSHIP